MAKRRSPAADSLAAKRNAAADAENPAPPPPNDGPKLTAAERRSWDVWVSARTDWRDADLRLLVRLVKAESRADELEKMTADEPLVVGSVNGPKANPVFIEVRAAQKALQDFVRLLGLNTRPVAASKAGSRGPAAGAGGSTGTRGKRGSVTPLVQKP